MRLKVIALTIIATASIAALSPAQARAILHGTPPSRTPIHRPASTATNTVAAVLFDDMVSS
jgi:hypothetical protein